MHGDPELLFRIFKEKHLFTENIMNFYQLVFLEKNFLENIHKKGRFWGNYPLLLPFLVRAMTPKIIFKNLDFICHKYRKLQKNLKHFKFW